MDWWHRDPESVDMDYVTAVINDSGVMLDHLEQLESYFADALAKDASDASSSSGGGAIAHSSTSGSSLRRLPPPSGAGPSPVALDEDEKDEFDREEEQQAKEDLAACEQDIPRAKV